MDRRRADFGQTFQSRSLTKSKNELLIVVTPRIVHPSDVAPANAGHAQGVPGSDGSGARAVAVTEVKSARRCEGH